MSFILRRAEMVLWQERPEVRNGVADEGLDEPRGHFGSARRVG